jgi:Flp pilus assembly protein CpaB
VSRRARAAAFAVAAALCAGLAASATGGSGGELAAQLGELRDVVVAVEPLPARRPLSRRTLHEALELRRVPERFVAPDALSNPAQALGRSPVAPIPAGGYLLGSLLEVEHAKGERPRRLGAGRRPVEITVEAAGALESAAAGPTRRVDVVVTEESGPVAARGRTYVAVAGVRLLDLRPAGEAQGQDVLPGPASGASVATLALTRAQALRLIEAESFARSVRLIGS